MTPIAKMLLSVGVYLCLVFVLGFVLALTARRESYQPDLSEDDT